MTKKILKEKIPPEKIIEDLKKRDDVIFMTSSQIGDWFVKEDGTNGENLKPFLEQPPD